MPRGSTFVSISAACQSLPALSILRVSFRSLPALLVVCLGVRRGVVCRAVVRCGVAYRSSFVSPCRSASRRAARSPVSFLLVAGCVSAGCWPLRWLVPVNRRVRRDGFACRPLLAWERAVGECVDYVDWLFSVDCFVVGVYIISCAVKVFFFLYFMALAFMRI